jgi:hypothetical protein
LKRIILFSWLISFIDYESQATPFIRVFNNKDFVVWLIVVSVLFGSSPLRIPNLLVKPSTLFYTLIIKIKTSRKVIDTLLE